MDKTTISNITILLLRVTLGVIFLGHGLQRMFGLFGGPGIDGTTALMSDLGFIFPPLWAWILASTECVAGIFMILGIMPRISSFLMAVVAAFVIFKMQSPKGFFAVQGGFEYSLLILVTSLYFTASGGGRFSFFDRL